MILRERDRERERAERERAERERELKTETLGLCASSKAKAHNRTIWDLLKAVVSDGQYITTLFISSLKIEREKRQKKPIHLSPSLVCVTMCIMCVRSLKSEMEKKEKKEKEKNTQYFMSC